MNIICFDHIVTSSTLFNHQEELSLTACLTLPLLKSGTSILNTHQIPNTQT